MIDESIRVNPDRSEVMSVEAKTAIIEHIGRQHQAMVVLLADLVNIDSGSYNKRGVDAVGDRLRAWLEAAGISCEIFPNEIFGDCMAARIPGIGGNRPIVLMGHRDTVFPDGTATQRPFRIDGDQAFGPGVADMKAGLVMNTVVLEALRRFGAPCPLTALYTSDEVGLTRFGGHPESLAGGAAAAKKTSTVFAGVSPTDGRARPCWR
jgi:glutamate carboxypeptidase